MIERNVPCTSRRGAVVTLTVPPSATPSTSHAGRAGRRVLRTPARGQGRGADRRGAAFLCRARPQGAPRQERTAGRLHARVPALAQHLRQDPVRRHSGWSRRCTRVVGVGLELAGGHARARGDPSTYSRCPRGRRASSPAAARRCAWPNHHAGPHGRDDAYRPRARRPAPQDAGPGARDRRTPREPACRDGLAQRVAKNAALSNDTRW